MRFFPFLLFFLVGCGSGDLGSSSSTTNVSSEQEQDNNQTLVPPGLEASCTITCLIDPETGLVVSANKTCEGSAVVVGIISSLDDCDTFTPINEEEGGLAIE